MSDKAFDAAFYLSPQQFEDRTPRPAVKSAA